MFEFIGIVLYMLMIVFTFDVLCRSGHWVMEYFPGVTCIIWPIFWTMYFLYHIPYKILKYPAKFGWYCYDKFATFVAERMK